MIELAALAVAYAWAAIIVVRTLHVLQLESYVNRRLLRWMIGDPWRTVRFIVRPGGSAKKPLVLTGRAIRIFAVALGLLAVCFAAAVYGAVVLYGDPAAALIAAAVLVPVSVMAVPVANWVLTPLQRVINGRFLRAAAARLNEIKPIVIGITGSYGKTSTKHFLQAMLSSKYRTLMTPGSYNTTMGVCRVINEKLTPAHEVFIAEMGAYGRAEIKEIAGFVRPKVGILTAIGPQHLEWFRTVDNVVATKYELIEALPAGGVALFNADDPHCRELANRTQAAKVLRFGISTPPDMLDLRAEEITHGRDGLSFVLVRRSGERAVVSTKLLGRHNVMNILAAATAALELGVTLDAVAASIGRLEAPAHRLQLVDAAGGVTVIDDAYNANPEGAAQALEVLSQFSGGRRILVTPGMVELGPLQDEANRNFGRQAAAVCDYAILVGPRQTRPIRAGLSDVGFAADRVIGVPTLQGATAALQRILQPGDIVLFENDLPDQYAEA